jgi:hypothetical protein
LARSQRKSVAAAALPPHYEATLRIPDFLPEFVAANNNLSMT